MKKKLITAILQCVAVNGLCNTGELFFTLAFKTESELKKIARELNINPETL